MATASAVRRRIGQQLAPLFRPPPRPLVLVPPWWPRAVAGLQSIGSRRWERSMAASGAVIHSVNGGGGFPHGAIDLTPADDAAAACWTSNHVRSLAPQRSARVADDPALGRRLAAPRFRRTPLFLDPVRRSRNERRTHAPPLLPAQATRAPPPASARLRPPQHASARLRTPQALESDQAVGGSGAHWRIQWGCGQSRTQRA